MHKNQADKKASTQDINLEIKINNRTHVDEKRGAGDIWRVSIFSLKFCLLIAFPSSLSKKESFVF